MKSGVILVLESVTRRQESFEMTNKIDAKYNILCRGRKIYSNLTEEEYFNTMEDLAIEFYQSGSPNPSEIETEIIGES